jgi:hypothetical protein
MSGSALVWPELPVAQWVDTRDTLQLMTQVLGKVRLANTPLMTIGGTSCCTCRHAA